ncbi:MAG: cell wall metabolism sensor histidine kinase WalK [Planctomycetes bacterium]|nr:cell wall metabolism sensor histidine kinase WalK [Planctomycetota bacterium]
MVMNLVAIVAFLSASVAYIEVNLKQDLYDNHARDLELRARLVTADLSNANGTLPARVQKLSEKSATRITVIDRDGKVLADSSHEAASMVNHIDRPEVVDAISNGVSSSVRFSDTVQQDLLYVALTDVDDKKANIIRLAIPRDQAIAETDLLYGSVFFMVLVLFLSGSGLSFVVAQMVIRPIRLVRRAADKLAKGNLDATLNITSKGEIGSLLEAFNSMSKEIRERVVQMEVSRRELSAIVDNMAEGVLLVNTKGDCLLANEAAAKLLDIELDKLKDCHLWESLRMAEVDELIASLPTLEHPRRMWVEVHNIPDQRQVLQFVATPVFTTADGLQQSVILVSDATEDQKLLEMRQDFVANVSHELKTPLTSISAYVDTLLDGAADDEAVRRPFMEKIKSNTTRLTKLVSDILNISRLESGTGDESRHNIDLNLFAEALLERQRDKADAKQIKLHFKAANVPAIAFGNEEDLTEAVENLIVNAISYTPENGDVTVNVESNNNGLELSVSDTGVGIPEESLARVFERFFRVDKARSRALGGTGLGLAIVKHVAIKHGGKVEATSEEGKGSTFKITLPKASRT